MSTEKEIKEHYEYLKKAVNSFVLPAFTRAFNWLWFNFLNYYLGVVFLAEFFFMLVYNSTDNLQKAEQLWFLMRGLFFTCFGIVILAFVSFIVKRMAIKKRATELGITVEEWNSYVDKKEKR